MPCDASYLEPNEREVESRSVASYINYLLDSGMFDGWYDPEKVKPYREAANDIYGDVKLLDEMTAFLCSLCRHMNEATKDRLMYNGRIAIARSLAGWWERHEQADAVRKLLFEETETMKFLSRFIDLKGHGDRATVVREFVEQLNRALDESDFLPYRDALEDVVKLCKNQEVSNNE